MKKIQRYVFTMACLLTGLGGYADSFKINELNVTYGTLTAKMGETNIIAGTTEIPFNTVVTLTVTPTSGYYLQSLTYEEVTDLGQAQALNVVILTFRQFIQSPYNTLKHTLEENIPSICPITMLL